MARTAAETAHILSSLYDTTFGRDSFEPFRISWPQLRSLAAVHRLNNTFLKNISEELSESEYCIIPFNDFLLVTGQQDLSHYRMVPDRMLEQYLPDGDEGVDESDGKDSYDDVIKQ